MANASDQVAFPHEPDPKKEADAEDTDKEKFTKTWFDRFAKGDAAKEGWETAYEIGRCKNYWKGKQLDEEFDEFNQRRVQINRVHPTVQASIPTLYFHNPVAKVNAKPSKADTPGQKPGLSIDDKAQLLQDQGNSFILDPGVNFDIATHYSLKEAQWAFGCVRVMYDNDPVENPAIDASGMPLKETKDTPVPPRRMGEVLGLNQFFITRSERFYIKRIPARQVMVSADHTGVLEENPYIGYWSIHYLEDVKRTRKYKNKEDLKASGVKTGEDTENRTSESSGLSSGDKIKLYHVWAFREKIYYVFAEGHKLPLLEAKYKRFPLKFLRFDVDPDSFLPIPPIYRMLHPQDEVNDSREWLRQNRKGTVARFTYDKDAVEPEDMKKLERGDMGTYIPRKANTHSVIEPVNQPNYSMVAAQTLSLAEKEFSELSMQAGEQRGVPQAGTATQAKIIDVRSQVQESFERMAVADFLAGIVEEMIRLSIDHMSLNRWVMNNADQFAQGFQLEAQRISEMYREITSAQLTEADEGVQWTVTIESASMSPVAEAEERDEWLQVMSLLGNAPMRNLLAVIPSMRRKTLSLYGLKSARDQEIIGEGLNFLMEMDQQAAMAGAPPGPGLASQPGAAPRGGGPPPAPKSVGPPAPGAAAAGAPMPAESMIQSAMRQP
jgi:hypothetical protein